VDETRAALNAVAIMPDHFKDFFIYLSFVHNWKYVLRMTLNKCKSHLFNLLADLFVFETLTMKRGNFNDL